MKLHGLVYDGEVLGIRVDCIPWCRYSLDLDLDLAKTLLTCIDKSKVVKSDTIPLRLIGDSVYATDDETNVVSVESLRDCLKYIPLEYRLSSCDIHEYADRKFNILLGELLKGTNIKVKWDKDHVVLNEKYRRLIFEGYDSSKYKRKFGIYFDMIGISWRDGSEGLEIMAKIFSIETVRVLDIGSFCNFKEYLNVFKEYDRTVRIDKRKRVTAPNIRSSVDEAMFYESFPDCVWAYGDIAVPVDCIEGIFKMDYMNIISQFKPVISRITSAVSMGVLNHLGEFRDLSLEKMKELSNTYPNCYCYRGDTPIFYELGSTESYIQAVGDTVGIEKGFRKFLVFEGELYLWFGVDRDLIGCNH